MVDALQGQLLAAALTAFSDGCTIPELTRTCPYYVETDIGPTCGEQCRQALAERGVSRPTESVEVLRGLVMTGVARPIEVAAGSSPFDATKTMLAELHCSPATANTSTLLLRLRGLAATRPDDRDGDEAFFGIWSELNKRGIPVDAVLRAVVAPAIAEQIMLLIDPVDGRWRGIRNAYYDQAGVQSPAAEFELQVAEWFARLASTDLHSFLKWQSPQIAILRALRPSPPDSEALWLWDRFTGTLLDNWHTSSLVLEWAWSHERFDTSCDPRVLAVRRVDVNEVAGAALERLAELAQIRVDRPPDLAAAQFTEQAAQYLRAGETDAAVDVFTALAYANPADGEALNNLGFCMIPQGAVRALGPLDRAASYPMKSRTVNTVNRALVRHLLQRDEEALELLSGLEPGSEESFVWVEPVCGSIRLDKMQLGDYVVQLVQHISQGIADQANR